MSKIVQLRRGNASEHDTFTGKIGEVTMDTDNKTLRVHDGETVGGTALAKQSEIPDLTPYDYVIEWQTPTADNNYTWYRKYKSGWIEMGGLLPATSNTGNITFRLPIKMANSNYTAFVTPANDDEVNPPIWCAVSIWDKTTTSFKIRQQGTPKNWVVFGFVE